MRAEEAHGWQSQPWPPCMVKMVMVVLVIARSWSRSPWSRWSWSRILLGMGWLLLNIKDNVIIGYYVTTLLLVITEHIYIEDNVI